MIIHKYKCDNCGKETEGLIQNKWIIIEGDNLCITVYDGYNEFGEVNEYITEIPTTLHFCSFECLVNYLRKKEEDK